MSQNLLKYLQAAKGDLSSYGFQNPIKREGDKVSLQSLIREVSSPINPGTPGRRNDFEAMIVKDFRDRARRLQTQQDLAIQKSAQSAMDDDDGRAAILQALGGKKLSSSYTKDQAAQDYAQKGLGRREDSLRGRMIQGNKWAADNPEIVIPVGVGAAAAGLTASGQAVLQLTANMANALRNEEKRDNVLSS